MIQINGTGSMDPVTHLVAATATVEEQTPFAIALTLPAGSFTVGETVVMTSGTVVADTKSITIADAHVDPATGAATLPFRITAFPNPGTYVIEFGKEGVPPSSLDVVLTVTVTPKPAAAPAPHAAGHAAPHPPETHEEATAPTVVAPAPASRMGCAGVMVSAVAFLLVAFAVWVYASLLIMGADFTQYAAWRVAMVPQYLTCKAFDDKPPEDGMTCPPSTEVPSWQEQLPSATQYLPRRPHLPSMGHPLQHVRQWWNDNSPPETPPAPPAPPSH